MDYLPQPGELLIIKRSNKGNSSQAAVFTEQWMLVVVLESVVE